MRLWFATFAILISSYSFGTNLYGRDFWLRPDHEGAATTLVTWLCIVLIGIAFYIRRLGLPRSLTYGLTALALAVAAVSRVLPHNLFLEEMGLSGRMGWNTFGLIWFLGLAGLLRRSALNFAALCMFMALAIGLNVLIGYSFGLRLPLGDMAFGTTLALVALGLATATLFTGFKPTRILFRRSSIGGITRALVLTSVLAPLASGLLLHHLVNTTEQGVPYEACVISLIVWVGVFNAVRAGHKLQNADVLRRRAETRFAKLATIDSLTGCLNRTGVALALGCDGPSAEGRALALIDLDHFKRINDTYGHNIGDRVLQEVRPALAPHLKTGESLGRWGGEEFVLCLRENDVGLLSCRIDQMRKALEEIPARIAATGAEAPKRVSASIGVNLCAAGDHFEVALAKADEALFAAKRAGRNRAVLYREMNRMAGAAPALN
ncbi:GGDEF domain-containing protein [Lentibacter sp.]|uniref:GGDEF domain-containing protein n=1 Tax=Lentibacter sp. TaxID=2024994 RepID=UPI003F6A0014